MGTIGKCASSFIFLIFFSSFLQGGNFSVENRGLYLDGKPFIVRGICYSPTPVGKSVASGYKWWKDDYYLSDLPILKEMGCNVIRTYDMTTTSSSEDERMRKVLDDFSEYGISVIMGYWVEPGQDFSSQSVRDNLKNGFINMVNEYKGNSAVLGWSFGNEVWPGGTGTDSQKWSAWYSLVEEVASQAKSIDPYHPVMTVNNDISTIGKFDFSSDDFSLSHLDIWGVNLYLGDTFQDRFSSFSSISSKPFLITEFGCDAWDGKNNREDENTQSSYIETQWSEIEDNLFTKSGTVIGGCVFEWVDEWWKSGQPSIHDTANNWFNYSYSDPNINEEWWGIRRIEFSPYSCSSRKAYYTLENSWGKYSSSTQTFAQNMYVFPNPFKPSRDGKLTFKNLPYGSNLIKIYDITGELIDVVNVKDGESYWYGESYHRKKISSGIYFFVVFPSENRGKVAVIK